MNLGGIYKDLGNLDQALTSTLRSLELKPDNPNASTWAASTKISATLIRPYLHSQITRTQTFDNPTAHTNLGGIYQDLGNLDQALTSTLRSLELKPIIQMRI